MDINMSFTDFLQMIKERGTYQAPQNTKSIEEAITSNIDRVIQEMISTITKMPTLSEIEGILPVYNVVRSVSIGCTGAIICYKGVKLLFSYDEIERAEGKQIFSRLAYSFSLGALSLKLIDVMIMFNNTLIKLLTSKFTVLPSMAALNKSYGIILSIVMLLVELYACIKIMIGFWMRMAELVFMGTISPAVFTMWINNEWSGFLRTWWRRCSVLIFSQFCQVLILVVYSMLINGLIIGGTFSGICLAIATLLLMESLPRFLGQFVDSGTNNFRVAKNTITKFINGKHIAKFFK